MAESIELEVLPAQNFEIPLGGNNYIIRVFSIGENMACDVYINNKNIVSGLKLVNEILMIPYEYQEVNGNLLLIVPENELPNYEMFGKTQFLVYFTAEETKLYRAREEVQ